MPLYGVSVLGVPMRYGWGMLIGHSGGKKIQRNSLVL